MSPQEKQELRERYERWKSLSPAEKGDLQRKLETWRKLPPEEKATRSMAAGLGWSPNFFMKAAISISPQISVRCVEKSFPVTWGRAILAKHFRDTNSRHGLSDLSRQRVVPGIVLRPQTTSRP